MLIALILIPALAGGLALLVRSDSLRRALLVTTALIHGALVASAWFAEPSPIFNNWLALDKQGLLFLSITSILFLSASLYAVAFLRREIHPVSDYIEERRIIHNAPEAVFTACLLCFLATMTLVTASQHLGLLWVAIEASTLASAPLIYFHRHQRSLEATWKYLMVCSVGVALALLGNFFIALSAMYGSVPGNMVFADLLKSAPHLQTVWLKAGFIFILVGYGTKMGLAPLHTWLPDAHSESPSLVSALLSGALLNCAFLGILRVHHLCVKASLAAFSQDLLVILGLASLCVAAIFIIGQTDYKRMLAYSSVEHMGILALGVGLGGAATFGSMLHLINHSFTKALLFLVAGNILATYQTKSVSRVTGLLRTIPISGALWLVGFFAITGTPPFGMFLSEFTILRSAIDQDRIFIAVLYLALLSVVFIGMTSVVLRMAQGKSSIIQSSAPPHKESLLSVIPPAALALCTLALGIYIPAPLSNLLHDISRILGGN